MKLYHGTGERFLNSILTDGLKPRAGRRGNWQHTVNSNRDAVYLTDAYAPYFCFTAAKGEKEGGIIVEIDTDKLGHTKVFLVPDEDVLAQVAHRQDNPSGKSLIDLTKQERKALRHYIGSDKWQLSLQAMGTCAFLNRVPVEAITRIGIYDRDQLVKFAFDWDATISVLNYRFLGDKYKKQTLRLFDDAPAVDPNRSAEERMFDRWQVPVKGNILTLTNGKVTGMYNVDLPEERTPYQEALAAMNAKQEQSEASHELQAP